jgi:uncharacterized membrane protein YdjX (TVP38/TMEM64 family)
MTISSDAFDSPLTQRHLLPSARSLVWVLLLFALAIVLARHYAAPIGATLSRHANVGVVLFVGTTALAVVLPLFSNLPLVPFAVLLWGPWWTALLILLGWVVGATLSFVIGRRLRPALLRAFPKVTRYAQIDQLIHPQHRLLSLTFLRMTFPMDALSYVLGLFSRQTTLFENALSTALGGAPFALLFGFFPALPVAWQVLVLVVSALGFGAYVMWVVQTHPRPIAAASS